MKRIYIVIFALLICCSKIATVDAQIISVADDAMLSIKSGTILTADQLQIIPSVDYTISENMLSLATSPSSSTGIANIRRVYKFNKVIRSFKGQFKLNYLDNELNGLTESGLKFLYNNGTAWTADNSSTVDAPNNQVQSSSLNSVSIKEITSGKALVVPLLSVTPLTQTICSGSSITPIVFSDISNEVGTTYSWTRDNTTNIKGLSASSGSGQSISGVFTNNATTAQLTTFTIKATNSKGSSTKTVTLTVNPALALSKQPAAVSINNGSNTYFEVGARGLGITYQWQLSTNSGGSWTNVANNSMYAGATTTKLSINKATFLMNGYLYRCIVSSSICGGPITSSSARLTVKNSSTIISTLNPITTQVEVGTTFIIHANPNPSPTAFKVYVSAPGNELVDVLLTDLRGKIILSIKVKPNESILLGDDLASATYILIAKQGSSVATTRIVKL